MNMTKPRSPFDNYLEDDRDALEYEAESLVFFVAESLREIMEEQGITGTELAERLSVSKSAVSQALAGGRNLTLRTLAKIAHALDHKAVFSLHEKVSERGSCERLPAIRVSAPGRRVVRIVDESGDELLGRSVEERDGELAA